MLDHFIKVDVEGLLQLGLHLDKLLEVANVVKNRGVSHLELPLGGLRLLFFDH